MKILFVTYDFPYPLTSGGKNRAYHLIKFAAKKHDVFLFSFVRAGFNNDHKEALKKIGVNTIHTFSRKKVVGIGNLFSSFSSSSIFKKLYFEESIKEKILSFVLEHKIDLVHFESFYTGFYISQELKNNKVTQIFGTENVEHLLYKNYVSSRVPFLLRFLFHKTIVNIKKEEEYMLKNSDAAIAVTEEEKKQIQAISDRQCFVVPNGVDVKTFTFEKRQKNGKNLLFIGDFSYFPNSDAIAYFYSKIFTQISNPDLRLTIVGKNVKRLSFVTDKRVVMHEYIEDIVRMYQSADIFVSPVRIGGGTNFKVLEAMATGLPTVADPARIDALEVKNNVELLTAEIPEDFKKAILQLLEDRSLYEKISKNAREFVIKHYSWDTIGEKLMEVYKK